MRYRLDAWTPGYGTPLPEAFAATDERLQAEPKEHPWSARADAERFEGPVYLIDGRQRFEGALYVEDAYPALLFSFAVGAVRLEPGRAQFYDPGWQVERYLLVAGEVPPGLLELGPGLAYRVWSCPAAQGYEALQEEAHTLRRQVEDRLGQRIADADPAALVLHDGPLYLTTGTTGTYARRLGYAKTQWSAYLSPEHAHLLPKLKPGERTPVFEIQKRAGPRVRSWYLRLPLEPDRPYAPAASLVRVETGADGEEAVQLARRSLELFARLASKPYRDPRAPQNLVPIGMLERELGRRLGRLEVIRARLLRNLSAGA